MLISVATIPAAANVGLAAAYGDWPEAGGAALQLAINLGMIFLAGFVTLYVQRLSYLVRRRRHRRQLERRSAVPQGAVSPAASSSPARSPRR